MEDYFLEYPGALSNILNVEGFYWEPELGRTIYFREEEDDYLDKWYIGYYEKTYEICGSEKPAIFRYVPIGYIEE